LRELTQKLISWGPAGVFLLALLDSAGIPLPGGVDALLIAVAVVQPDSAYGSAALAIIGSIIGSLVLFYLARRGGQKYLDRHTTTGRARRMREWYREYGLLTVFVPALVPIPLPLKLFVICSGALNIGLVPFTLTLLAARIPRYFGLAWLGASLGSGALDYLRQHVWALLALAVLLFLLLIVIVRNLRQIQRS
jgi:membrane protein YqaA with SNARE-associated domain